MKKGATQYSETQGLMGNITPLKTFDIQHFDDGVKLSVGDFVVANGHLYSVENPTVDYKLQPKKFSVYSATLNSIL